MFSLLVFLERQKKEAKERHDAFHYNRSDEMGLYDMPASLNYVLRVTRQKKLSFVGYSIGCTMFFVAMITHPELNERVDVMFAFAPTSTLADFRVAPVRTFLPFWNFLHVIEFI